MARLVCNILLILAAISAASQTRVIKPAKKQYPKTTNFGIGAGVTRSVIYLNRNVKEDNDARGYNFSLIYGGSSLLRGSLEYTHYRSISIEPTWYNIKASTIEFNMHIIARFKKTNAFFYPLFGFSYNMFSGYFTGRNDFLNLRERYPVNTTVVTNWSGLNVGTGYEHYIRPVSIFIDYKMRIGFAERRNLNIMDVCFSVGIRYNLKVPSIYKLFSGTRSRYLLDTEQAQN
jgi:hypothetical protein